MTTKAEIDIIIDTSLDLETITLTFCLNDAKRTIEFSIPEAQMLHLWLGEAITKVIFHKLEQSLEIPPTKH